MESRFKDLFFQLQPRVFRVAYYILKDASAAEDVCQEVFIKFWEMRSKWDNIQSIEGYLILMTKNRAFDYLKGVQQEAEKVLELKADTASMKSKNNEATDELRLKFEKAVSKLSPQCRLVFSLSRFEGLDNDEIASYLNISKRTVETQISQALKRFRTDLRHIFFPSLLLTLILLALV